MAFTFSYTPERITLRLAPQRTGLIGRLTGRVAVQDLDHLPSGDRALAFALADLRAAAEARPSDLSIDGDTIRMTHRLAAELDSQAADVLGLPPLIDLTFRTDVEGVLGTPSFRLRHEWIKAGRRQLPKRVGAILSTADGPRRLPLWLLEAVEVAEAFVPGTDDAAHWEALARFRRALDPGVEVRSAGAEARVSMTDFLQSLEVRLADRFSIAPVERPDGLDFEVIPFSGRSLAEGAQEAGEVGEDQGELHGPSLAAFQKRMRVRGALSAYRVGEGSYLVVDRAAKPVLEMMAEKQRAPVAERVAFVTNPRPAISSAIEAHLRASGKLEGLSPIGEEEAIEAVAGPMLVETREFSERVTGLTVYRGGASSWQSSGTTWLPELFAGHVAEALDRMAAPELATLRDRIREAVDQGDGTVEIGEHRMPATPETLNAVEARLRRMDLGEQPEPTGLSDEASTDGPIILETEENFEAVHWRPERTPRMPSPPLDHPSGIRTALKPHQVESFQWQVAAWAAGLPGVLNADEQGLGKTLQTIAFLRWLKTRMSQGLTTERGPVLVVAPTSLLENWEAEVSRHLDDDGLGYLIRLYGAGIGQVRPAGRAGLETATGEAVLDLRALHEAVAEGRAHRFWLLTTYTTLTNYQHSLARIPFSAIVFDEIQALKNPTSLRACAVRAMQADFRIGLTGTPIENATEDLWAIMDQLCPGALDDLRAFRERYATPNDTNMAELHARIFRSQDGLPPLALRRIKDEVARDLPAKTRRLHPRAMPPGQAATYDEARVKLVGGSRGGALKLLHHIRSVSVHPTLDMGGSNDAFIAASARLSATFDILQGIRATNERALVFIEHRQMQYRFIELVRQEFGLNRVDLINGETPIQKRQVIVDRFQQGGGFELLVLGPKAAGTGLTLTSATHVIHLSRWWNPAVEEQCNDRVHRIGQTRPVTVHVPMAVHPSYREHSFDCLLHSLMSRKRQLATSALWPMGDTEDDAAQLQRMLSEETRSASGDPVEEAMFAMFARDGVPLPPRQPDGSLLFG